MPDSTNTTVTGKAPTDRVSPPFRLLQMLLIKFLAAEGVTTADIASRLDVNRSYVIRLVEAGLTMVPASPREKTLFDLATDTYANKVQQMGLKGLLANVDHPIVLAGGERPKLGSLVERRAAQAEAAAALAANPPVPKPPKVAKAHAVPKEAKAPEPKAPEPKAAESKAPESEAAKAPKKERGTKASAPVAPEPAPTPTPTPTGATKGPANDTVVLGQPGTTGRRRRAAA